MAVKATILTNHKWHLPLSHKAEGNKISLLEHLTEKEREKFLTNFTCSCQPLLFWWPICSMDVYRDLAGSLMTSSCTMAAVVSSCLQSLGRFWYFSIASICGTISPEFFGLVRKTLYSSRKPGISWPLFFCLFSPEMTFHSNFSDCHVYFVEVWRKLKFHIPDF